MTNPLLEPGHIVTATVTELAPPSQEARQAILAAPVSADSFARAFTDQAVLHAVQVQAPASPAQVGGSARIVFWNAERLKYLTPSIALLRAPRADALVLCEVDVGMVRSGDRHTIRDLAQALDAGFVFGVEFVELGLGDLRERAEFAGRKNQHGLHGAGFVSCAELGRPALVRLETSGRWFDGTFHERRVGGRIAMFAELDLAGTPVLLVSAHYESHTHPTDRLLQTQVMLDAIDRHAPGRPVLIGGDFNTSTFDRVLKHDAAYVLQALEANPDRLVAPERYEPMFDLLAERGYAWNACNVPFAPTQRTRPDGTPQPPFGKIDWFFSRGLLCRDAEVIPAMDASGTAISDHEALAVTISLA